MKERLQIFFSDLIRGKRKGITSTLLKALLLPLSFVFKGVASSRQWAFERGYLSKYHPPIPLVISVGNIVAGGTGKTPVTLMLAKEFYSDYTIAILSRGYRSLVEKESYPVTLSVGTGPLYPAETCGDEPYLLARNLPKAIVLVGKDRCASAHLAAHYGPHVILLDDGMQHQRLGRDLDIVVMNANDPFGQGHFLPRGLLRESPHALSRANLIIINHVRNTAHYETLKRQLKMYSNAPCIGSRMEIVSLQDLKGNLVSSITGKKVGLFCGIAHPEQFQATVQELGAKTIASRIFSDHQTFNRDELFQFATECKNLGAEMLICTEKDFVKLIDFPDLPLPVIWPQMQLCIVEDKAHWQAFISKAKTILSRSEQNLIASKETLK